MHIFLNVNRLPPKRKHILITNLLYHIHVCARRPGWMTCLSQTPREAQNLAAGAEQRKLSGCWLIGKSQQNQTACDSATLVSQLTCLQIQYLTHVLCLQARLHAKERELRSQQAALERKTQEVMIISAKCLRRTPLWLIHVCACEVQSVIHETVQKRTAQFALHSSLRFYWCPHPPWTHTYSLSILSLTISLSLSCSVSLTHSCLYVYI